MTITLDWSGTGDAPRATVGDPKPCTLCGGLAIIRHPVTKLPCHKTCEEARLDRVAAEVGERV